MSEDFISGLHTDLVEAMDRYERRESRSRFAARRYPRLPRPVAPMRVAAAAALIVALVAVVVTVARESDVEREAAPPGEKVVATDVERGVRFSLDGRVLTVQLLPDGREVLETVSGAEISATCGTNVAAPPGDPRGETTVFRIWPAGETSLSYRFPRDVSGWCRLDRPSVGIVASVSFPVAWSGAREQIAETADNWARVFASTEQACNDIHGLVRLQADRVPTGGRQAHRGLQSVVVTRLEHALGQGLGMGAPRREGPEDRHQRRPSGRHALERRRRDRHGPAATYRDGRVADRQARRGRADGGATAEAAGSGRLTFRPMELGGLEPPTSWVRSRRSPN